MSNIPKKKHSDKELSDLRARSAMQANNSNLAETYNKKLANKGVVVLGYILPLIGPIWAIKMKASDEIGYEMSDFYIMTIPIVLALLIALWITLKRELSRHNSAFILIISLLCCFPAVNAVNSDKFLKYDVMSLIGKEGPMPVNDPLFDSDIDAGDSGMDADEIRKQLREEEDRIRRENIELKRSKDTAPVAPEP